MAAREFSVREPGLPATYEVTAFPNDLEDDTDARLEPDRGGTRCSSGGLRIGSGNHADAGDCFQETFVSAPSATRRQRVENWGGFLQRVATALTLDRLRYRRRRASRDGSVVDVTPLRCPGLGPLDLAEFRELNEQVRLALADLPPKQAEVVCLHDSKAGAIKTSVDTWGSPATRLAACCTGPGPGFEKRWGPWSPIEKAEVVMTPDDRIDQDLAASATPRSPKGLPGDRLADLGGSAS